MSTIYQGRVRALAAAMGFALSTLAFAQVPVVAPKASLAQPTAAATNKGQGPGRPANSNLNLAAAKPTSRVTVATIAKVEGSVLVSTPTGLVAAKRGTTLPNGFRVVTAGKSEARIRFSDGCEVYLSALQRYQVDATLSCPERIKTVSSLVLDPAALQLALGGSTESIALAAAGGGFGGPAAVGGGLLGAGAAIGGGTTEPGVPPGPPVSPN